jgi:quercetin dioxygenase-like cupin family protein
MSATKKKKSASKKSKWMKVTKRVGSKQAALKNTVSPQVPDDAALNYLSWNDVHLETMNPLLQRQLIVGNQVMLARVLLKKGCIVPLHSHENEQLSYILEGALKFWIDGKEIVVHAGEVLTIPPNMPHKAEALEDTVDLDIFHPPRADWLNKTDAYLRK